MFRNEPEFGSKLQESKPCVLIRFKYPTDGKIPRKCLRDNRQAQKIKTTLISLFKKSKMLLYSLNGDVGQTRVPWGGRSPDFNRPGEQSAGLTHNYVVP